MGGLDSWMEKPRSLEAQCLYRVEQRVGFLHEAEQGWIITHM